MAALRRSSSPEQQSGGSYADAVPPGDHSQADAPVCSITSKQTDELALDAHPVGREDPHFVSGVGGLEGDRSAAPAEAL